MTTTPNRHYSLPSRHHDVVDDINDLRTTFGAVDEDITDIESAVTELSDDVSDTQAAVIHTDSALENTEIQNIAANRYLVVNSAGNGFECLDGGGDAGGKPGQCSIKKSDQSFDTAWGDVLNVSKNGMIVQENAETSESGETHIFVDETEIDNGEQLPKVELTNCQAKSDFESDSNSSVIICDAIEEVKEEIQTATNLNYGFIKVGNGLSIDNGTLSAPVISQATSESFGIMKAGSGLVNNSGVISYDSISPATPSSFGVVKLGENLSVNANGEMEIDDMGTSATIYDLGNVKVCSNGIVDLEEATLRYRLFITEDLVIQFSMDFEPRDDFSFVLELVSDGTHIVAFNENLNPQMSTLPINRGTTKIKFTKKLGVPSYDFEISRLDAPAPILLTPNYGDDINSNLLITHNGSNWDAHDMMNSGTSNISFSGRELTFEFTTLVVVDYVYFTSAVPTEALGEFYLRASNDKQNWTTVLYKNNETVNGKVSTETKGCFRYFKLYIGWKNSNYPRSIQLWGTQIDNNESELFLLTASGQMTATYSNLAAGSMSDLISANPGTWAEVRYSSTDATDLTRWIKYEFNEPVVANFLDVAAHSDNTARSMRWYKLEGSNDDEDWTLLLERQYQRDFCSLEARWHEFENSTAYKFYKLTCLQTNSDQYWRISRFRLFRRDLGKHNLYRGVPKLSSANQDGYEISSSSVHDEVNNSALKAFDDEASTIWVGLGSSDVWLRVKLPSAQAFNTFKILARSDEYLNESPQNFSLQGSNDDENWDTLSTITGCSWTSGETKTFTFNNETAYEYYRLYISTNCGGGNTGISGLILGRTVHDYKRLLNGYNYVVPVLTGQTTSTEEGSYVITASSSSTYAILWGPFDRSTSAGGHFELADQVTSGWIQIQLPTAKAADTFKIGARDGQYCGDTPRNYNLCGSNNGQNWNTLFSIENSAAWSSGELRQHNFENETAYCYYRLNFSNPSSGRGICGISLWDLLKKQIIREY